MDVLLQVNTSGEATKSGVEPDELQGLFERVAVIPGIRVQGLMTIGSVQPDPELGRPEFRLLIDLAPEVGASRSGDEVALHGDEPRLRGRD